MELYILLYLVSAVGGFLVINKAQIKELGNSTGKYEYHMRAGSHLGYIVFYGILGFLACRRYGIGTDYFLYKKGYDGTAGWWEIVDMRGVFGWLVKVFTGLNLPYQVFIAFFSVVSLGIIFKIILRCSWNPWLSITAFLGLSYYSFSLSGFRQFCAMMLLVLAIYINTENKKIKHLKLSTVLVLIIAAAIHETSVVASIIIIAIFYWKPQKKTIYRFSIIGVGVFALTRISLTYINKLIALIVSYSGYYSNYLNYTGSQYYRLYSQGTSLYATVLLIPSMYLVYKIIESYNAGEFQLTDFSYMMLKIYFFYEMFLCLNMSSEMIDRFAFYFAISVVFIYPIFTKYVQWKSGKKAAMQVFLFLIAAMLYMFTRYLGTNAYGIVPYSWIFSGV